MIVRWEEPCGGMNMLGIIAEFPCSDEAVKHSIIKTIRYRMPLHRIINQLLDCQSV